MKQTLKRMLSLTLVLCMLLSMLPASVLAADADYVVGEIVTAEGSTAVPTGTIPMGSHWEGPEKSLSTTCGEDEHTHTDGCYTTPDLTACKHHLESVTLGHPSECQYISEACSKSWPSCWKEHETINGVRGHVGFKCTHMHSKSCYTLGCSYALKGEHTHTEPSCYSYTWTLAWDVLDVNVTVTGNDNVTASGYPTTATYGTDVEFTLSATGDAYNTWTATIGGSAYVLSASEATTVTAKAVTSGDIKVELSSEAVETYEVNLTSETLDGCSAVASAESNLLAGANFTVTVTTPKNTDSVKYSPVVTATGEGASSSLTSSTEGENTKVLVYTVVVGNADVAVNVTYNKVALSGNKTAEIEFNPSKTAAAQLDALKQELFNKLAVDYVPGGVTYDQVTYEHKYYETWTVEGKLPITNQSDEYTTIGTDPADRDVTVGYYTTHPFGYTGVGTVEHVKLSYNGLSIEADVTLVPPKYTVTWVDENGNELEKDEDVVHGTSPEFNGEEPAKAADAQYTYTFAGWTPAVGAVTGDVTYTASYTNTTNQYKVTFKNEDGTVLQSTVLDYGAAIVAPADPSKAATAEWTYTFAGWDKDVDATVTSNVEYTATYTAAKNSYTVVYTVNGVEVGRQTGEYGTALNLPATPADYVDANGTNWKFVSWDTKGATTIVGEAEYTALFTQGDNNAKIIHADGTETYCKTLKTALDKVKTGETVVLLADAVQAGELGIDVDGITIDGKGYSITADPNYGWLDTSKLLKPSKYYLAAIRGDNVTVKNITFACGNLGKGVDVIGAQNVIVENVAVSQAKATALNIASSTVTVVGKLTATSVILGDSKSVAGNTGIVAEDGAIFTGTVTFQQDSYAYTDMDKALDNNGSVYFGIKIMDAEGNLTGYRKGSEPANLTLMDGYTYKLLRDTTLKSNATLVWKDAPFSSATLDLNGKTLDINAGKIIAVQGNLYVKGEGAVVGNIELAATEIGVYGSDKLPVGKNAGVPDTYFVYYDGEKHFLETSYTITFKNEDGTELQSSAVAYGTVPTYTGETPTKTADEYIYSFAGWNVEPVAVTGEATYTATFNKSALNAHDGSIELNGGDWTAVDNNMHIKVLNAAGLPTTGFTVIWNDMELPMTTVQQGLNNATLMASVGGTLEFTIKDNVTGLTKGVKMAVTEERRAAVIGDLTYTTSNFDTEAQFKSAVETAIKGNIKDVKGNTIEPVVTFDYNTNADGSYNVTANVVIGSNWLASKRTFENVTWTVNKYAITWIDGNGNELYTEQVAYGETPTYTGAIPAKDATAQYTYTFNNTWDPAITAVSGKATYTAQFDATTNKYTVTWVDGDGNKIYDEQVAYGTVPSYDINKGGTPAKTGSGSTQYTWNTAWETDVVAVTGDATYKAAFTTDNVYIVTFDHYGNGYYTYGYVNSTKGETKLASVADPVDVENYIFDAWYAADGTKFTAETEVTGNITVKAEWTPDANDNNVLDSTETGTIKVTVEGNGDVTLAPAGNATLLKQEGNVYTYLWDSTNDANKVINVTAAPKDTDGKDGSADYVVSAPATVKVGEEIAVKFATQTLTGSNNGIIKANGFETASKLEAVTKGAVLKAILGKELTEDELAEYQVKMYVQIADVPVIGTISGYYDIWNVASWGGNSETVQAFINSAIEKALDVPGTESFEVTWKEAGKPEVTKIFTVNLEDIRPLAKVQHNGNPYNASVLDQALLDAITADLTFVAAERTIPVQFTTAFAEGNPTELVAGQNYDIKVVVTLDESVDYRRNEQTISVSVHAPYTKGSIVIAETANMTYNTGMTDADKTAMVLEAVKPQYTPASLKDVETTVWYKANEARNVPLTINFKAMDLGIYANFLPESATIQVPVSDKWMNIGDEFPETKAPTNEQIQDILLNDLIPNYGFAFVKGELSEDQLYAILALTLQKNPDLKLYYEYLGAHKFGENEKTDENGNVLETVYLTQKDTGLGAVSSNYATLTLADLRKETTIQLNSGVAVTYNAYTAEELMTALFGGVYDSEGNKIDGAEVAFVSEVEGLPASEAMEVTVKFSGDKDYKPSTATATIVINKAPVSVTIDNQMVKYGDKMNTLPVTTTPAGVDNIQFIVGLDVSDVNINNGVKGIVGNVQLLLPEELQSMLEMAGDAINAATGLNISFSDGASMKLSELQAAVDALSGILQGSNYEEYFNVLLNMLSSLPTEVADIQITIGGTLPTNIGVYLIGAVTADANYETAFGVGALVIYPDGIKAELDWVQKDDNHILTRSLLTTKGENGKYLFDTSAYATSVGQGGTIEAATEQAYELFLGVDINGEIVLETDQTQLEIGAYTEVAMIVNWGNQMYYSAPIARVFAVIAETLDVDYLDENGNVNNERFYTFDNTPKNGMEGKDNLLVTYKQDGANYAAGDRVINAAYNVKYYYVGMQTNGKPYASTTAPTHAGAYTVTAIVTILNAKGEITHAGQGIGALVIEPADSDVTVANAAYKVDGTGHKVNELVTATSAVKGLTPDTTVISAGVGTDGTFSENGLAAVQGTVNVDLPKWLDNVMDKLNILEAAYTDEGISIDVFEGYISTIQSGLADLGMDTAAFDEIVSVLGQLPENVTLTFHDDKAYTNVGAYLVVAVVTDSDHYPSVGAGLMVIYPDATQVDLKFDEDWNNNNIFTWNALQVIDLDAKAYDHGTNDLNAEATELVTNVYLGVADDGKIILTNNKATLDNGVYSQVAFLLDIDGVMYYAKPISRAFMIVPNPVTITFVDETGAENDDRIFEFNNEPHAMDKVVLTDAYGQVIADQTGLKITYTGVQNNLKPYNSTKAPVHAGSYVVTAIYSARDDQNRVVNLGAEVGAMLITPTESNVTVENAAIKYDGNAHGVKDLVTATSTVANLTPDTTVISAGITTDGTFSENALEAIVGTVNVDLPKWLDDVMIENDLLQAGYTEEGITAETFKAYAKNTHNALEKLGLDTAAFDKVSEVIDQLPNSVKVNFQDDAAYTSVGTYLVLAVVTDSDHYPSVDAGVMVIYPNATKVELKYDEDWNGNDVFTLDYLKKTNMGASAYDMTTGDLNKDATKLVHDLYFGIGTNDEIILTFNKNDLVSGVYTEFSFLTDLGSEVYYAMPISRSFIVAPNAAEVIFVDETGAENNDRIFTFDGAEKAMSVMVNGQLMTPGEDLTVVYTGVSTTAPYVSTQAPTHAGAYTVTATYIGRDDKGQIAEAGIAVGAMVIEAAEATVSVDSQAVIEGEDYQIVVNTTDAAAYDDVKTITILAGVDVTTLNSLGLASVNTVVNVDFPAKVDEVLKKIAPAAYGDGISTQTMKDLRGDIIEALSTIGFDTTEYERTQAILEKMGDVTVTFKELDDAKPTAVGTYVIIASTFDPDYKAAMDVAMLVIAPNAAAVELGFDMEIPGMLNIMPYELVENFDFTASAQKAVNILGKEVDLNEVNPYVKDVIFGITTDLELFFGSSANKPNELGVYDQLSYVENSETTTYVALPAFRTFSVVKSTADVKFYDESGYVNWVRKFTYDGEAHGMNACLVYADGTVASQIPNVLYIGVEGNGTGYFSTQAPTEVGVYDVIGYYISESENIYAVGFGAMAIEKATLVFDLTDTNVTYNGEEQFVDVVNPLGADYISVIETENGANMIFPAELEALAELLPAEADLTGMKNALEAAASKLEGVEIDSDFISKLVEVLEELNAKLPGTITVNGKNPVACGEYTAYAVSYAANYLPEAARGVLTIEHDYVPEVTAPTCTEDGYTTYTCSCCDDTYIADEVAALGHTEGETVVENEVAPTCGEEGSYDNVVYCTVCGEELSRVTQTVPVVAHEYGEPEFFWNEDYTRATAVRTCVNDESHKDGAVADCEEEVTTDPTCTAEGTKTYTAKFTFKNGDTAVGIKDVAIPALGHTEGEVVVENNVDPDCTNDGSYDNVVYCTVCGEELSRETITVDKLGHTEGATVVENNVDPDCTNDGSYDNVVYCTVCGEELSRETITVDKLGHDYKSVVTAPTCTDGGYTTYTCSVCGDTYKADEVDALGHNYDAVVTDPTCTEGGYTTYTCSVCGDSYADAYTAPVGHKYDKVVTAPTCTDGGYTTYTCSVCNDSYVDDHTAPKGHSYTSVVTAPTCTEGGYTTHTCSVCGDKYVDSYTTPKGHSYESVVTAPTCTEGGYTTHTCSVCGDSYVDDYTSPKGHSYESVVTGPTCTEAGYTTHTCSDCGDSYVDSYVDAKGHSWDEGVETTPATADKDGVKTFTCTECHETKTETIQALGHVFDEGKVTKEPTCTEKGEMTYTCENCDDHKVIEEIDALGHAWDEGMVTAPTCTEKGYTTYTCTRENCDESYVDKYVSATGHTHVKGAVTAPTCTERGYTTYTCACGDSYKADFVQATGHTAELKNAKEATCTEKGYTGDQYCKTCDTKLATGTEIPAKGHKEVLVGAKAATATTDGYTGDTVCETCGEVLKKGEVIPAFGEEHKHQYTSEVTKEATCTADGVKTYTCSCGDTYTEAIKATGHKFGDWAPVNDPSCFVPEEFERKCSACGEVEKKTGDVDTTYCPSEENFTDIFKDQWYHEATDFVIVNGLMNGTGGKSFSPDMGASRAMIVTTLYRMEGSPAVSGKAPYPDVESNSWYTDAIIWGTQNGIVNGYGDGNFGPNDVVTREQIATIFQRYAKFKGMDVSASADLSAYPDDQEVSDWAMAGIQWANKTGLMTGRSNDGVITLSPKVGTIRTELATLLMRWCKEFAD